VENLHLDATSEHDWLDSIQSFNATFETKVKFEIYGHRLLGPRKHVAMAEKTMQNILDARDGPDGVVKLELDTANHASAAKLVVKIRSVSDGNKEDLKEAVNQAGLRGIMAVPSVIGGAVDAVQTADAFVPGAVSFSETWDPILEKLKALQTIGDHLSEIHPYAKLAWSILTFIPKEIQKQVQLDSDVTSLARTMNDTFDIVEKADQLRRDSKSKIIVRMVQQTTECAWFIRDYIKIEEFCMLR